ncbi:MAG: rhodanese-like domain-containing protein [Anaerolineae bacterium]|nr:rhodanese-like domain-containing protein [Anaerolineae bacterium]
MRDPHRRSISLVIGAFLLLSACSGAVGTAQVEQVAVAVGAIAELPPDVTPEELAALLDTGEVVVVDVREEDEYAAGHIPGAILIPLGSLTSRLGEVPTDRPVVLVCRSDNRSGEAYRLLTDRGFDNVSNMVGGMIAWQAAGLEVAR